MELSGRSIRGSSGSHSKALWQVVWLQGHGVVSLSISLINSYPLALQSRILAGAFYWLPYSVDTVAWSTILFYEGEQRRILPYRICFKWLLWFWGTFINSVHFVMFWCFCYFQSRESEEYLRLRRINMIVTRVHYFYKFHYTHGFAYHIAKVILLSLRTN